MKKQLRKKLNFSVFFFLLPGILGFTLFYLFPFFISLRYSFLDNPANGNFVGLKNFFELLKNPAYLLGLQNTFKFIAVSVPINMLLSLLVAMGINKIPGRKEFFSLLFLIPLVIPSGSMAFFWKSLFDYNGALNSLLNQLGVAKINWLDSNLSFFVVVLIFIWKNLGYNMILYLTSLKNIPIEYYEAASIDGASSFQTFRGVTLPNLTGTNILVFTMSIINSFKIFKEIYLLTGNYPHNSIYTLQHFLNNMFAGLNYPKLTTATIILIVFVSLITQTLLKIERKGN